VGRKKVDADPSDSKQAQAEKDDLWETRETHYGVPAGRMGGWVGHVRRRIQKPTQVQSPLSWIDICSFLMAMASGDLRPVNSKGTGAEGSLPSRGAFPAHAGHGPSWRGGSRASLPAVAAGPAPLANTL